MSHKTLSRRGFVVSAVSAAGGLAIGVAIPGLARAMTGSDGLVHPGEVNAWILIEPDETVVIRIPHSEMGQGAATALPMIVAEELECDWKKVKGEFADANRSIRENEVYSDQRTTGSRGVATSHKYLQQAGASARVRLIAAAAQVWNVPESECAAANGAVSHAGSNRTLSYGKLASSAARIKLDAEPAIKKPGAFKLIGTSQPRLDTKVKVDGSAQYGIDTREDGMHFASIMSVPVNSGKLVRVDDSAVTSMRGIVKVVSLPNAVAVVANSYWRAHEALKALKITWDMGPGATLNSASLSKMYHDGLNGPSKEVRKDGDAASLLADANVIEAVYEAPLLAHATMEPLNATVQLRDGRLDVWTGTQAALNLLKQAARDSGLKPEQIHIHNTFLGGGFGRRSMGDEMAQAIALVKILNDGKKLKLIWSREQDIRHDRYRPQSVTRMRAALTQDGAISAMEVNVSCGAINSSINTDGTWKKQPADGAVENAAVDGLANSSYQIPNYRVTAHIKNTHIPNGHWRSVGGSQNGFFIESFIDELAHKAGKDPIAFRRAMLKRKDFLGVLDMLEEKSNWHEKLPKGRGRGVAVLENHRAVAGHVAEVTVDDAGNVRIDRVVGVVDCYHVVNPKIVESQVEGGIIFALSAFLYGEITIKDGAVEQGNFDTYRMVRLSDAPHVEAYLSPSGGERWAGVGEVSVAPLAAAVANAIFAATGKRIRSLPLKNIKLAEMASL